MATTNVSIEMDSELLREFEIFCDAVGMDVQTAFSLFIHKTVNEGRIPLEVNVKRPNAETLQALQELSMIEADPSCTKSYGTVEEMMVDILGSRFDPYAAPNSR